MPQGYIRRIIDKLLALQDRFYPEVEEYYRAGEGRVALLKVVGVDGDSVLLKCEKGRVRYADGNEKPVHVFRTSVDVFLDLVSGDRDLRECIAKGSFVIEDASTGTVDVVELEKWAKAFERLRRIVTRYVGGRR